MNRLNSCFVDVGEDGAKVFRLIDSCNVCKMKWDIRASEPRKSKFAGVWYKKKINEIKAHKKLCELKKLMPKDETFGLDCDTNESIEG